MNRETNQENKKNKSSLTEGKNMVEPNTEEKEIFSEEYLLRLFRETPLTVEKLEEIDTQLNAVEEKLMWILSYLQKLKIRDYLLLLERPVYLLWVNFLSGIARGLGIAIGFTILGALAVMILQQMQVLNLPIIGNFISELLKYIDINDLNTRV